MERDLDDTVRAVPRPPEVRQGEDVEDTVTRGTVDAPVAPPALVEPPAPPPRPLPVFVEPVAVEPAAVEPAAVRAVVPDIPAPAPAAKAACRAVFADGSEVALDVTVYAGRKPSIPRVHAGPDPRLVTLASPGKEVSATHLELKTVGGAVVATDMRSTNGTVVQLPGAARRTLIRGESAVVVPGTRIDLGDGAVVDILPPRETVTR